MDRPPRVAAGAPAHARACWPGRCCGTARSRRWPGMAGYFFLNWLHGWPAAPLAPVGTPVYALATTMTLACIVAAQVGAVFACRTDRASVLSVGLLTNRLVLLGVAVELALLGLLLYVPLLQRGLRHGAPRPAGAGLPADLAAGHPAGRRGAQGAAPPAGRPRRRAPPGRRRRAPGTAEEEGDADRGGRVRAVGRRAGPNPPAGRPRRGGGRPRPGRLRPAGRRLPRPDGRRRRRSTGRCCGRRASSRRTPWPP